VKADLAREQRLVVTRWAYVVFARYVRRRQQREHAGRFRRGASVDAHDSRVQVWRSHRPGVGATTHRHRDIVDVLRLARDVAARRFVTVRFSDVIRRHGPILAELRGR
jgi:hypothetical protein